MKDKLLENYHHIVLIAEAILIIFDLIFFGQAKEGMICYWGIVIMYHISHILERKK